MVSVQNQKHYGDHVIGGRCHHMRRQDLLNQCQQSPPHPSRLPLTSIEHDRGKVGNSVQATLLFGAPLNTKSGLRIRPADAVVVIANVAHFVLSVDFLMCTVCLPAVSNVLFELCM